MGGISYLKSLIRGRGQLPHICSEGEVLPNTHRLVPFLPFGRNAMGLLPGVRGGWAGSRTQVHLPHPRWCKMRLETTGAVAAILGLRGKDGLKVILSSSWLIFLSELWGGGDKLRCSRYLPVLELVNAPINLVC